MRSTTTWRVTGVVAVVSALAVGLAGCSDDDSADRARRRPDTAPGSGSAADATAAEQQEVIAAREAALVAHMESVAATGANPELPALYDTMTGTALDRSRGLAHVEQQSGNGWRWPANSMHRLIVQSVTLSPDDPDIAWLETCLVDDSEHVVVATGLAWHGGTPWTSQLTEEMRQEDGRWRLAESFTNSRTESATGCAAPPAERPVDRQPSQDERRAVIDARIAAEQAWLAGLVNPTVAAPLDLYGGYLAEWWGDHTETWGDERCPISIPERPAITEQSYTSDPCVRTNWIGTSADSFYLHHAGIPLSPTSTADVVVESVTFQPVDPPQVAYLRSCRSFNLTTTDGQPVAYGRATVRGTETMHRDPTSGTWKLSGRWSFTVDEDASSC